MYKKNAPESIKAMFANIAPSYDAANAFMSLGLHKKWNRALLHEVGPFEGKHVLDLCCGTGDISLPLLKKEPTATVSLLDFCPAMIGEAKIKAHKWKLNPKNLEYFVADAQKLPMKSALYDIATIAYGIRNVQEPKRCFEEVFRVLKKGGTFGILELTRPTLPFLAWGHRLYLTTFLPLFGGVVAKDRAAYRYLSKSIRTFSTPTELKKLIRGVGFQNITSKSLLFGSATLIVGKK